MPAFLSKLRCLRTSLEPYWEYLSPVLLLVINYHIFISLQKLYSYALTWAGILIVYSPLLFAYCLIRIAMPPLASATLVSLVHLIVSIAHSLKLIYTSTPLQYADLAAIENYTIIYHYLTTPQYFLFACIPVLVYFSCKINRYAISPRKFTVYAAGAFVFSIPTFHPYIESINYPAAQKIYDAFSRQGIQTGKFISYDTVHFNGLPVYIIQTSRPDRLPPTSIENKQKYIDLLAQSAISAKARHTLQNIIIILCESCWYDKNNFYQEASRIRHLDFHELRGIAPIYGGGTYNSTFEMLTGLPAHGFPFPNKHRGPGIPVIYQLYGEQFSPEAETLVSALRKQGFQTTAAENFYGFFWKNNIVSKKFGFKEFYSIESMPVSENPGRYPEDSIMYNHVARKTNFNMPNFIFLNTVYTHGPYASTEDYSSRLQTAMNQMADFIKHVLDSDHNALILIFGDHMPAMNDYFYKHAIIPRDMLTEHGFTAKADTVSLGNVPVLIHAPGGDDARLRSFLKEADGKSLYCISTLLDRHFLRSGHPVFAYAAEHRTCEQYTPQTYNQNIQLYPDWLYAMSLFEPPAPAAAQEPAPAAAPEAEPAPAPQ